VGKFIGREEGKKKNGKAQKESKRGKGVLFIPSVNFKYNHIEKYVCSRNFQA
jgi:hypothetical protein